MKRISNLLRLIKIASVIGYYRLDELLPGFMQGPLLKLSLLPFKLKKHNDLAPGERLRLACEELGPIFIKLGQVLSTRPDIIPPELIIELNKLQDRVAPFDGEEFCALVEKSLGKPLDEAFSAFDRQPLASASIAQVHTATLHTGEDVVVKAVRPHIEEIIKKDTALMHTLANMLERYTPHGKRLRPIEVVNEYQQTIFDELNLIRETANATQLKRNFEKSSMLYVPKVYWPHCRKDVMVMERIYGAQINDLETLKQHNVNLEALAVRGVEIFFTQVFDHNFFHADMHPGNVYVDLSDPKDPNYIALDMAIMGSLEREDQYYLARNLLAMFRRNYREVAELHVLSGWVPKHISVSAFESAIRSVCEPIFEKPLKEISFGDALIHLFQTAQRFEMPVQPQLVLLQKTLLNIEGLGRQLYPDLDLWETAHPYLERWIKRRYSPRTLIKEFRKQAPEWMERAPEVPHLLLETTTNLNAAAESLQLEQQRAQKKGASGIKQALIAGCLGGATIIGWPVLVQLPALSWVLVASASILAAWQFQR